MKRKLASVPRVVAVHPVPGADAIEAVTIQGWQRVVEEGGLTARLGVGKYEPTLPAACGDARCAFSGVLPKTDEMRLQSVPAVPDELRGKAYVATLKCDGTSSTFLIDPHDDTFRVCGRNWSLREGEDLYWGIAHTLELEPKLRAYAGRFAIQGEICGPGVQKNPLGLARHDLFVFSVYDLAERLFLGDGERARGAHEPDRGPGGRARRRVRPRPGVAPRPRGRALPRHEERARRRSATSTS